GALLDCRSPGALAAACLLYTGRVSAAPFPPGRFHLMPGRRAVCPEGHTLLLDETPSSRRLFCPDCRRDVDVILLGSQPADDEIQTAPEPTPRGLWALMGRTPAASPGSEQPETT